MEHKIISRKEAKESGLKHYYTGKPCPRGHIAERATGNGACIICGRERAREKSMEYYYKNREKIRAEFKKKYHENREFYLEKAKRTTNKEKAILRSRKWRDSNYEKHRENVRTWRKSNREKTNKRTRERAKEDKIFAVSLYARTIVRRAFLSHGYKKDSRTQEVIGCSYEYFMKHIERQFQKGMTWENRNTWHLDHVIPLSSAKTKEEVMALSHFTNIRPMWAKDNLAKSNKMEYLI